MDFDMSNIKLESVDEVYRDGAVNPDSGLHDFSLPASSQGLHDSSYNTEHQSPQDGGGGDPDMSNIKLESVDEIYPDMDADHPESGLHDSPHTAEPEKNYNTERKTAHDISALKAFILKKQREDPGPDLGDPGDEDFDLVSLPVEQLNGYMTDFLLNARKPDGSDYEASSLRSMFQSFDRYLRENNYQWSLKLSNEFESARMARKEKLFQLNTGKITVSRFNSVTNLTDAELATMFEKGVLGMATPQALINTLWWNNNRFIGIRGCREHHNLRWGDMQCLWGERDGRNVHYLHFQKEAKKKSAATDVVIWPTSGDPNDPSDPVSVYLLYREKRPHAARNSDSPFYLSPNFTISKGDRFRNDPYDVTCRPENWFRIMPFGINAFSGILKNMVKAAGIEEDGAGGGAAASSGSGKGGGLGMKSILVPVQSTIVIQHQTHTEVAGFTQQSGYTPIAPKPSAASATATGHQQHPRLLGHSMNRDHPSRANTTITSYKEESNSPSYDIGHQIDSRNTDEANDNTEKFDRKRKTMDDEDNVQYDRNRSFKEDSGRGYYDNSRRERSPPPFKMNRNKSNADDYHHQDFASHSQRRGWESGREELPRRVCSGRGGSRHVCCIHGYEDVGVQTDITLGVNVDVEWVVRSRPQGGNGGGRREADGGPDRDRGQRNRDENSSNNSNNSNNNSGNLHGGNSGGDTGRLGRGLDRVDHCLDNGGCISDSVNSGKEQDHLNSNNSNNCSILHDRRQRNNNSIENSDERRYSGNGSGNRGNNRQDKFNNFGHDRSQGNDDRDDNTNDGRYSGNDRQEQDNLNSNNSNNCNNLIEGQSDSDLEYGTDEECQKDFNIIKSNKCSDLHGKKDDLNNVDDEKLDGSEEFNVLNFNSKYKAKSVDGINTLKCETYEDMKEECQSMRRNIAYLSKEKHKTLDLKSQKVRRKWISRFRFSPRGRKFNRKSILHRKKFYCPGLHCYCIRSGDQWITPKQFSIMGGKASLKNWKNAIRIHGINLRTFIEAGTLDFCDHKTNCSGKCSHKTASGLGKYQSRINCLEQKQLGTIQQFNQALGEQTSSACSTPNTSLNTSLGEVDSNSMDDMPANMGNRMLQNLVSSPAFDALRKSFGEDNEGGSDQPVFPTPVIKTERIDDDTMESNPDGVGGTPAKLPRLEEVHSIGGVGPMSPHHRLAGPSGGLTVTSTPVVNSAAMMAGFNTAISNGLNPLLPKPSASVAASPLITGGTPQFGFPVMTSSQYFPAHMKPLLASTSNGPKKPLVTYLVQNGQVLGEVKQAGANSFIMQKPAAVPPPDVASVASSFPGIDSLMKDSLSFWKGILEIGILEEIFLDIKNKLRCIKQEMLNNALSEENSRQLSDIVNSLDLQTRVKYKLANHKVNSEKQNTALQKELQALRQKVEENQRQQAEIKRKSDCLDQLITVKKLRLEHMETQHESPLIKVEPEEEEVDENPLPGNSSSSSSSSRAAVKRKAASPVKVVIEEEEEEDEDEDYYNEDEDTDMDDENDDNLSADEVSTTTTTGDNPTDQKHTAKNSGSRSDTSLSSPATSLRRIDASLSSPATSLRRIDASLSSPATSSRRRVTRNSASAEACVLRSNSRVVCNNDDLDLGDNDDGDNNQADLVTTSSQHHKNK